MKKKIHHNISKWLSEILKQRISNELNLFIDSNNWIINIKQSEKKILIPLNYLFYYSFFNNQFPHTNFNINVEFLSKYSILPAPGYSFTSKSLLSEESNHFKINFDTF